MKNKNNILTITIIALVIIISCLLIFNSNATHNLTTNGLQEITYKEITKKQENKDDFILIVSRSDCSHCITYKPKVDEIAKNNNIIVYYIDTDKLSNPEEFLNEFNLDNATPMTLFFIKGKETSVLNRIEGDLSASSVKAKFKKMGFID